MINLYLIDYDKEQKNHGLNTYVNELSNGLIHNSNIKLHFVWVNSSKHKIFTKEFAGNTTHLYIPKIANSPTEPNAFDVNLAAILAEDMQAKENLLVHINWINHCSLAWHLKQKVTCKIVLTKHCIPWRDMVTNNYREFYVLDQALNRKEKIQTINPQLIKEQINYEYIDHIITVTNCAKTSLNTLFDVPVNKITIVNNGLNATGFKKYSQIQKDKLRIKYGFSLNEKIIFFAGNVNQRKGIAELVKVFEQLVSIKEYQNTRLVIAGPGDFALVLTTAKKHWTKITLTGSLGKANLYDFYLMADIGIVPSYIEQCSYTAIEMMHSGLPIIVTDVDGLKEMVNDDCGLRAKVDFKKNGVSVNAKDLQTKIAFLLNNPTEALRLAVNAKKNALIHFSADRMAKETLAVYEKVFQEKPAQTPAVAAAPISLSENPMVTVIMPCYNAKKFIAYAIQSILDQSFTDFELIVVDDGSTDTTCQVLQTFTDPRIRSYRSETNQGNYTARNQGIRLAKGKYIAMLDADDVALPDYLLTMVCYLESHPKVGCIGAQSEVINENGQIISRITTASDYSLVKVLSIKNNFLIHSTMMIRHSLIKKHRLLYDETFKYAGDYDFVVRVIKLTRFINLNQILLHYRSHPEQITATKRVEQAQYADRVRKTQLDTFGIDYNEQDLELHLKLMKGLHLERAEIEKGTVWFNRLINANENEKKYHQKHLFNLLKQILMEALAKTAREEKIKQW